jgi:hypothetical protein
MRRNSLDCGNRPNIIRTEFQNEFSGEMAKERVYANRFVATEISFFLQVFNSGLLRFDCLFLSSIL